MTKKLNEEAIKNELQGSAFFQKPQQPTPEPETMPPSNHDTVHDTEQDTVIPRYHDIDLEPVRKALKSFGKEPATHRFTSDEKRALSKLIFLYREESIRTSENEIARIAINFIIQDHNKNKGESILDQVLKMLHQ